MSDGPSKVTALFGNYTPSAGTTATMVQRAENSVKALHERKASAYGAVVIDEEGQARFFFYADPLKTTALIGGVALLQQLLATDVIAKDLVDDTPPPPEGTTA